MSPLSEEHTGGTKDGCSRPTWDPPAGNLSLGGSLGLAVTLRTAPPFTGISLAGASKCYPCLLRALPPLYFLGMALSKFLAQLILP